MNVIICRYPSYNPTTGSGNAYEDDKIRPNTPINMDNVLSYENLGLVYSKGSQYIYAFRFHLNYLAKKELSFQTSKEQREPLVPYIDWFVDDSAKLAMIQDDVDSFCTAGTPAVGYYLHDQISASATWTINHNLGFHPAVTVFDSSNRRVWGVESHTSVNQVVVTFGGASFAGVAYCS